MGARTAARPSTVSASSLVAAWGAADHTRTARTTGAAMLFRAHSSTTRSASIGTSHRSSRISGSSGTATSQSTSAPRSCG